MTVTETLWMYARMRGVAEADIKNLVDKMIEQLTLKKHAEKQAKNLRRVCKLLHSISDKTILILLT